MKNRGRYRGPSRIVYTYETNFVPLPSRNARLISLSLEDLRLNVFRFTHIIGPIEKPTYTDVKRFAARSRGVICTLPADRLRAEHGIRLAYETAKLKPPLKIVWTTSPFSQGLTRAIVPGTASYERCRGEINHHIQVHPSLWWGSVRCRKE